MNTPSNAAGNQVVIVTGASGDLGRAICATILDAGNTVIGVDINTAPLAPLVQANPDTLHLIVADCANEAAVNDYTNDIVKAFGRVDGLCNNVGGEGNGFSILDTAIEEFNRVLSLNVTSAFLNSRAVARTMTKERKGAIVNVSSISGLVGSGNDTSYTTAKHAVVGLTRAMAAELGKFNIRTNCVCPGPIESHLMNDFEATQTDQSVRKWYEANTPLQRYGIADEVASAVVFLLSDSAKFLNGAIIPIDGGLTATGRV